MKKFQIVIGFAVIFLIGFALGYRVKDKLDKREGQNIVSDPVGSKNSSATNPILHTKDIYFLIRENNIGDISEPAKKEALEKMLSTARLKFHFRILGRTPDETFKKDGEKKPTNMGMVDALRALEYQQQGIIVQPVYSASPRENVECYSEMQVVSNGGVDTLEGLAGKSIGIEQSSISLASGIFKKLQTKGITVKKMYVYKKPIIALSDLSGGTIDAYFDRVNVYSDGEIVSRMTATAKGQYIGYPNFQTLHATANKIPCKVIFISSKISKEAREELKNKFMDVFSNPSTKEAATSGVQIGSLREITPELWKPVQEYYNQISTFQPKTFAQDIVYF